MYIVPNVQNVLNYLLYSTFIFVQVFKMLIKPFVNCCLFKTQAICSRTVITKDAMTFIHVRIMVLSCMLCWVLGFIISAVFFIIEKLSWVRVGRTSRNQQLKKKTHGKSIYLLLFHVGVIHTTCGCWRGLVEFVGLVERKSDFPSSV